MHSCVQNDTHTHFSVMESFYVSIICGIFHFSWLSDSVSSGFATVCLIYSIIGCLDCFQFLLSFSVIQWTFFYIWFYNQNAKFLSKNPQSGITGWCGKASSGRNTGFRVRDLGLIFDLLPVWSCANYCMSMIYSFLTCKLDLY